MQFLTPRFENKNAAVPLALDRAISPSRPTCPSGESSWHRLHSLALRSGFLASLWAVSSPKGPSEGWKGKCELFAGRTRPCRKGWTSDSRAFSHRGGRKKRVRRLKTLEGRNWCYSLITKCAGKYKILVSQPTQSILITSPNLSHIFSIIRIILSNGHGD